MFVLLSTLWILDAFLSAEGFGCCRRHTSGFDHCGVACNKYEAQRDMSMRYEKLKELPVHCPGHMTKFWQCMNKSSSAISKYIGYNRSTYQRTCCILGSSSACKKACLTGKESEIKASCFRNDEDSAMFRCLQRHEASKNCCRSASTDCMRACQVVFSSDNVPSEVQKTRMNRKCHRRRNRPVATCVNKLTSRTPVGRPKSLQCCKKADNAKCKRACQSELMSGKMTHQILDNIIKVCKEPFGVKKENSEMWHCLYKGVSPKGKPSEEPVSNAVHAYDGARLQCCPKAVDSECFRICVSMHSSPWGKKQNWAVFDLKCAYDPAETAMMNCLADVSEPCQLGCTGLNFCTNFNNRHTELFRSCKTSSDVAAKRFMSDLQQKGHISLPQMIHIKDITKCLPETWKALVCVLQIKPCSVKSHRSTICRSDCINILRKCGNATFFSEEDAVEKVCNELSPSEDQSSCISIDKYLKPSKYTDVTDQVTHPCNPHPCGGEEVCDINRQCYTTPVDMCESHQCLPGCPLGDTKTFLVRSGEYARVPVASGRRGCFEVCYCNPTGNLVNCIQLECVPHLPCDDKVNGGKIEDGARLKIGCNFCTCFSGELMCTKKQCSAPTLSSQDESERTISRRNHSPSDVDYDMAVTHSGLSCGCAPVYEPVCGPNGKTYHNQCLARCAGFNSTQLRRGTCVSWNPCEPNPCGKHGRCVEDRKTCLAVDQVCSQYYCVDKGSFCSNIRLEPVCDTTNTQHPNPCTLLSSRKTMAYKGFCKEECKDPVCGVNGETFSSRCAALSSRVTVDYDGECKAVGSDKGSACDEVECPPMKAKNCQGIVPPGACCPRCAAQVRILYSLNQLDVNSFGFNNRGPVTLERVQASLRRHITTSECDLFGYQSIEGDIVVQVMVITNTPTELQVEACNREAQKIEALINTGSPAFTSDVVLSTLKGAWSEVPKFSVVSLPQRSSASNCRSSMVFVLTCSLLHFMWRRTGLS